LRRHPPFCERGGILKWRMTLSLIRPIPEKRHYMIYSEILSSYENHKNLSGKAWGHAVAIDLLN